MYQSNNLLVIKPISVQARAITNQWPGFELHVYSNKLRAKGKLQPTSRSEKYQIQLDYTLNKRPEITVLSPKLMRNSKNENIPHMYGQKTLCLYQPKYHEFKFSDLISETIIPWASLWLYHYEVWHLTGKWLGGGEHP